MHEAVSLNLECPAKINLAMSVGPLRADGFHPIASWMMALRFADHLELQRLDQLPSFYDIAFAEHAPLAAKVDWPLEKDLVFRAHQWMETTLDRKLPVKMKLRKQVPAGAGLGGGSGDAAAMLVGLDQLFSLQLGMSKLCEIASQLGSDVVFAVAALCGHRAAVVTGRGEIIEPCVLAGQVHVVLILSGLHCPTGEVYRTFDELFTQMPGKEHPQESRVRELAGSWPLLHDAPFNDLAEAACVVRPELRQVIQRVELASQMPVHVTGSGSGLFIICDHAEEASQLAQRIREQTRYVTVATSSR